jgi:DNA-binding transcriptional ArsR family regulator
VAVLAQAGLVIREKQGRQPRCRLAATPMKAAMQWLARYE